MSLFSIPSFKIFCLLLLVVKPVFTQLPSFLNQYLHQRDSLSRITISLFEETETTIIETFTLESTSRDTITGRIRTPKTSSRKFPLAFLVVGIETGKEVVKMIEGFDSVIVAAIDYPAIAPWDFSGTKLFSTPFAMKENAHSTIPRLLLCMDYLARHPLVDTNDITLAAVSFGVFTGVPVSVLDQRVKRLVVIQAGGDMYEILNANATRLQIPIPPFLAGWLGMWLYSDFEPNKYISFFSPRPLLLVSGESDTFFPRSSVESLYRNAQEPKEWIRHTSKHVTPGEQELINELTEIVAKKLYGKQR
ncbi:MAG: alpha/beta hydrolase [Ignavibacteria bacterium]|nr:alpha/beta hydrolase [Ignavibacteria bacterium]